jgi:hypothetical protein
MAGKTLCQMEPIMQARLAAAKAAREAPMDAPTFRTLCARCGWSARQVAAAWGHSASASTSWTAGRYAVPADVAAWLAEVAAVIARHPTPAPLPVLAQKNTRPPQIGA